MPHVASSNRLFSGVQTDCRPGASWWVPGSRPNCALWMQHEDTVQPPQHPSPPARTLRMLAWSAAARQTSSSAAQLSEELFGFAPSSSTLYLFIFFTQLVLRCLTAALFSLPRGCSSFLEKCYSIPHYIYPESVYSWRARNQSGAGPAWCGRRARHSFMDPSWEDRMTPDRPRKCPDPPPSLYK